VDAATCLPGSSCEVLAACGACFDFMTAIAASPMPATSTKSPPAIMSALPAENPLGSGAYTASG
jgi:hypothetical protein